MRTFSLTTTVIEYASLDELNQNERRLVLDARRAREEAYAPYSNFLVGAALLLEDGTTILGANQENASYGMTACAERTAIWRAWLQGHARAILGIAITGGMRDEHLEPPPEQRQPIRPCGACRQVLSEAGFRARRSLFVLLDSRGGVLYRLDDVESLLPLSFDPRTLGVEPG
ncbi:MAG: cytidine deaminase [Myxococcales bacterium]|nr:cytidine deaminase [Polyangiaceae bacterium]MDW8248485.1 cytidine deaminase [Myxococcales bacterium]